MVLCINYNFLFDGAIQNEMLQKLGTIPYSYIAMRGEGVKCRYHNAVCRNFTLPQYSCPGFRRVSSKVTRVSVTANITPAEEEGRLLACSVAVGLQGRVPWGGDRTVGGRGVWDMPPKETLRRW